MRDAHVAMALVGWTVIVPACVAALATGVVQSLGTPWGLFRHDWVVIKLARMAAATAVLLLHMRPIDEVARAAAAGPLSLGDLRGVRTQLAVDAAAAPAVLLVTTALLVYKPRGLTDTAGGRPETSATRSVARSVEAERVTGRTNPARRADRGARARTPDRRLGPPHEAPLPSGTLYAA